MTVSHAFHVTASGCVMVPFATAGSDIATCIAPKSSGEPPGFSAKTLTFTCELLAMRVARLPSHPNQVMWLDGSVISSLPHGMRTRIALVLESTYHSDSESKSACLGSPSP